MASVVCPHCSSKIRLTRKKSKSNPAEQPRVNPQANNKTSHDGAPKQTKPPRLPVPDVVTSETQTSDVPQPETHPDDSPIIKTRRRRPKINLDGLDIDDSDDSELDDPELESDGEEDGFPIIKTRRKRERISFDNLEPDDTEFEPPNPIDSQQPADPDLDPIEIETRRKRKQPKPPRQVKPPAEQKIEPKRRSPNVPQPTKVTKPRRKKPEPPATPPIQADLVPERRSLDVPAPSSDSTRETPSKDSHKLAVPKPVTAPLTPQSSELSSSELSSSELSSSELSSSELSSSELSSSAETYSPTEGEVDSRTDHEPRETPHNSDDAIQVESEIENDLAGHLLPPKFLIADIEADENAVVLPTAGGGFQVVDKTEVRVTHEGRTVTLVALTPEELKRTRLIENLVALLIAGIMLAIAVWLVL